MRGPGRVNRSNMKTFDMGGPRVDIDNIAEALAYAEGEGFK